MIKAVIFDMDGVLIDAKEWHYEALNKALDLFGFEITRHQHITTYDGLPTRRKLQMLSEQNGLPVGLHTCVNKLKQKFTMSMVHELCAPFFPHQHALSQLKSKGFKIAVASNSIRASVETMMRQADLIEYLDFYLSAEDVSNGKPDPAIYNLAIKKLGLMPHECLILEDNPHGIQAAQASGAHVLVVKDVYDVNLENIKSRIDNIEGGI